MSEYKNNVITVSELRTYLYSVEREKERTKAKEIHEYKLRCNANCMKPKKREIAKIEKSVEKEYTDLLNIVDKTAELLDELKAIPQDIEKLEIVEYMLYRVDLRKTEKVINKVSKSLKSDYQDIQEKIEKLIHEFPVFDGLERIDYSEYSTDGTNFAKTKEQYRLEYTEEERNRLIQKELDTVEKAVLFNSIPIPHEILKNSDKDIQSKMQKFNNIRAKRIRVLSSMREDYKKLIDPRELLEVIDDALSSIDTIQNILTKAEYSTVRKALIRRRKKVYRSTNDIRAMIEAKEKKTGIANFNIQQARYQRMENLRQIISEGTQTIRENQIEPIEGQLEKLKISYEREKQFASVIEKLDGGRNGTSHTELRAFEEQIASLQYKLANSRKAVNTSQERIANAKKELLVLWKMEISMAVSKRKETLELVAPDAKGEEPKRKQKTIFGKLKKVSGGKHACT